MYLVDVTNKLLIQAGLHRENICFHDLANDSVSTTEVVVLFFGSDDYTNIASII
jgi:hypothetical protein